MNLPLFFSRRYLVSKKSTNAINIISGVSAAGMLVGSLGLILVLSVFNGFENLVESLYNSFYPDIVVTASTGKTFSLPPEKIALLKKTTGVAAISQTIEENALFQYGEHSFPAIIKGVDDEFTKVSGVDSAIYHGRYLLRAGNVDYAVLGVGIEQALSVNYDDPIGYVSVYVPKRGSTVTVNPADAFSRELIKPAGSFSIQQDFDLKYVFVSIDFARRLLNYTNQISSLEIAVAKGSDADKVIQSLQSLLGNDFTIKNRFQQNEVLYKVMKSEKWAVYAVLTFILIVAAFNIIGSLSMLVIEKKSDIAILKTMGADTSLIRNIFLSEGLLLSLVGCGAGFLLAIVISVLQQQFGLLKIGGGTFVVDAYPVQMRAGDFVLVFVTVLLIGLLASWFPSNKAAVQEGKTKND